MSKSFGVCVTMLIWVSPIDRYLHIVDPQTQIPKPVLRSEYNVIPTEYIELHFDGQAYPMQRTKVTSHQSLRVKLQQIQGSPKCVQVPATSFEEFLSLFWFLEKGDYPPDISERLPAMSTVAKGPPRIGEFKHDSMPYLVTDIRAYSIAKRTEFEELGKRAVERLHAQIFTHNDPMEALEEIYIRLEPSVRGGDLRLWVKRWLVVDRGDGVTNFEHLCEDAQWKQRFSRLRAKGGDFLADCDAVQNELARGRGHSNSYTSLLSAGSTVIGSGAGSSGGITTPLFAPSPMPSPTFRDSIPTRAFAEHRHGYIPPSRSQTPYWPSGSGYGWSPDSIWLR
jgi:hypothetical protein